MATDTNVIPSHKLLSLLNMIYRYILPTPTVANISMTPNRNISVYLYSKFHTYRIVLVIIKTILIILCFVILLIGGIIATILDKYNRKPNSTC